MALTLGLRAAYANGNAAFNRQINSAISLTGTALVHGVQNIGTVEETIAMGDVGAGGYAIFYNLDDTNFIEIGAATGVYVIKLKPFDFAVLRLDGWSSVYALADTGACDLEYYLMAN